jgi:hypothetical protein
MYRPNAWRYRSDMANGLGGNIELVTGLQNLKTRGGKDAARRVLLAEN